MTQDVSIAIRHSIAAPRMRRIVGPCPRLILIEATFTLFRLAVRNTAEPGP